MSLTTPHRQSIPISLDTMVVAVPPSARYTAVLDLECTALSLLLLTSQSRGSVEMTQVEGRHRLREYGVFTRFLIFSPDPDLPSCVDSPTENQSTRNELQGRTVFRSGGAGWASKAVDRVLVWRAPGLSSPPAPHRPRQWRLSVTLALWKWKQRCQKLKAIDSTATTRASLSYIRLQPNRTKLDGKIKGLNFTNRSNQSL